MHTSLKNITERAQKCDFSVNIHILIEQTGFRSDILCQKVDITRHCVFPLNIALKKTFQLKMHTSLKNITERAQKCDFSVNIPIYIAYNKSKARHFRSESWHYPSLCFST